MDEILDLEYLLRPLTDPAANARIERFDIRSKRQAEFDRAEQYENFVEYGSEFGEAQAPEPADWPSFKRACEQHIANKAKDLWVCAWYQECLLMVYGFDGLAEGFKFAKELIEQHWDIIEPNPNGEDGVEETVKMLAGLNNGSTFIDQMMMTPITIESGEHRPLTCATVEQVDGTIRGQLIGNTDREFRERLAAGIRAAGEAFEELCNTLKEKCGEDNAPPSAKIREAISNCESKIQEIYPEVFVLPVDEGEGGDGETNQISQVAGVVDGGVNMSAVSHVQNREEAFRMLESVANFFRENEPQSPVSYLLEKAVRWGRMPLPDLIAEMVENDDAKSQIFRLAGIQNESGDDEY